MVNLTTAQLRKLVTCPKLVNVSLELVLTEVKVIIKIEIFQYNKNYQIIIKGMNHWIYQGSLLKILVQNNQKYKDNNKKSTIA